VTFKEKGVWIYGILSAVVPFAYLAWIVDQSRTTAVAEIGYQVPMVVAVAAVVVLFIVFTIAATIASPEGAGKKDQRDTEIDRHGELIGYYVISVGVMAALVLAMVRADQFWIANSMYLVGTVAALVSSVVKIMAYRRGFQP
jgi:hypothetical protein